MTADDARSGGRRVPLARVLEQQRYGLALEMLRHEAGSVADRQVASWALLCHERLVGLCETARRVGGRGEARELEVEVQRDLHQLQAAWAKCADSPALAHFLVVLADAHRRHWEALDWGRCSPDQDWQASAVREFGRALTGWLSPRDRQSD